MLTSTPDLEKLILTYNPDPENPLDPDVDAHIHSRFRESDANIDPLERS